MYTESLSVPGIARIYRTRYCDRDHTACARFSLASVVGPRAVPLNLMPNQHHKLENARTP